LNAEGFLSYCERYSKTIYAVSQTMKPLEQYKGPNMNKIAEQLEQMCPLEDLPSRRKWRDECLTKLAQMKKDI
jgi:L-gulonate 3-dehydrogenase